jgi:hypothetical protein
MASINKLLDKVNQASSAVKSLKGIQSKLEGKSYKGTYDKDMLASEKAKSENLLNERRASLQKNQDASNVARQAAREVPLTITRDLQYPIESLDSYIVFTTRPRKRREGKGVGFFGGGGGSDNGKNLLSNESVAVALYVPAELDFSQDVKWSTIAVGANIRNAAGIADGTAQFGSAFEEMVQSGLTKLADSVTGGVSNFMYGKAKNPMEEQMFEGVDFRSHSFDYEFYPKNQDEARAVEDIIWTFKTAMLPDTYGAAEKEGAAESYFNYPNLFDITYEGLIAEHYDDFLPCVLTGVDVAHSTKMFEDGYPVSTTMGLKFTEIKIVTQETFQQISKSSRAVNIGSGNESLLGTNAGKNFEKNQEQKEKVSKRTKRKERRQKRRAARRKRWRDWWNGDDGKTSSRSGR